MTTRKLRIAQIITGLVLGGGGQVMWTIARNFDRSQFEMDVFCVIGGGELVPEIERLGMNVSIIPAYFSATPYKYRPDRILELSRQLRRGGYDLAHTHLFQADVIGGIASRLAGIPHVVKSLHNMGAWKKRHHLLVDRLVSARTRRVICCSHHLAESATRQEGLDPARVVTIHHGVDVRRFDVQVDRARLLAELGLDPEKRVVGTIGRPIDEKGHRYLLEAIPAVRVQHPDVQVLIVGEGPLRADLQAWVHAQGLDGVVKLPGARGDIPQLLRAMDVFAFPSLMEGLGIAVLESMAAGTPVVASNIRPLSEIVVDEENGLLVQPRNAAALAAAINRLLENPSLAERLRTRALEDVSTRFSEREMVAAHERVYREVCGAGAA